MSTLRSALEEWTKEDLETLDIESLADDLAELEIVSGLIEAERLRRTNIFEERSGPASLGHPSMTAFLKHRCGIAAGRAHRLVAWSRVRNIATATFQSWEEGRLSTDQAGVLLDQAVDIPDQFGEAESRLIDAVEGLGVTDTRRAIAYWRQSVDGPGTIEDLNEQYELRGVSASRSINGMVRIDGWLTRLAGQAFLTALDTLTPPPAPDDRRTPGQRRHDALEDLSRHYLDSKDTPQVGGERPHTNIVCDLPALQGIAGGLHETDDGTVLTIPELRMLSCDSSVCRVVLGPNSEIIDVGRRTRVVPAALRRAVIARDRHCTWKGGCDRNPRWCDVHHDRHWADGGTTDPCNCRLLCRFHHTLTHLLEHLGLDPP